MNTERVFTAFDKDGEELLLLINEHKYYDIITGLEYEKDKIDLLTLSRISNSIDLRKYMLKYSIINKYKKDRNKLLDTKKYLIGLKVVVRDYQKWYTGRGIYNKVAYHRWKQEYNGYDLYRFINKKEVDFETTLDIYTNLNNEPFYGYYSDNEPEKLYKMPDFKNGKEFIIIENNLCNITQESYLDKKTILEKAYKLRKNINF